MEKDEQIKHLLKLVKLLDRTNVTQQDLVMKIAEQYKEQHNLLRGYNKVTNNMAGDRKVS